MADTYFGKYQWSRFNEDRSEQFVIRVDSWDDLIEYRNKSLSLIGVPTVEKEITKPSSPTAVSQNEDSVTVPASAQVKAPICPIHGIPKIYKPGGISKAGKPFRGFWSCAMRIEPTQENPNGYCPGR